MLLLISSLLFAAPLPPVSSATSIATGTGKDTVLANPASSLPADEQATSQKTPLGGLTKSSLPAPAAAESPATQTSVAEQAGDQKVIVSDQFVPGKNDLSRPTTTVRHADLGEPEETGHAEWEQEDAQKAILNAVGTQTQP